MVVSGLDSFLRKTAAEVDAEIENFFPKRVSGRWFSGYLGRMEFGFDSEAVQRSVAGPVWDFLSRGGKRWRPALMILACEAVGGRKKIVMPFTPIPELIHNGTIIIDDLEDNSTLRRGKPALHISYGVDVAVNAGNTLYFLPLLKLVQDKGLSPEKKSAIYDLVVSEMVKLSLGQAMDINWHRGIGQVSEGQYLQMCSFKTGSLARAAVGLGAILGDSGKKQLSCLLDFATSIGVAFQIHDDILNVKPQEGWGKETGDDIKEGKRTLMVIRAFAVLPENEKQRLRFILDSKSNSDAEVKEAIGLLEKCGAVGYASNAAKALVSKCWKKLDASLKASEAKSLLKEFADYVVERKI
ncbi:Short chain isoprenyl diphosphate synthase [uncultured archaeon]|nr:Short chain isoprenyl diphosphate synthase [uncultured archaeon]